MSGKFRGIARRLDEVLSACARHRGEPNLNYGRRFYSEETRLLRSGPDLGSQCLWPGNNCFRFACVMPFFEFGILSDRLRCKFSGA